MPEKIDCVMWVTGDHVDGIMFSDGYSYVGHDAGKKAQEHAHVIGDDAGTMQIVEREVYPTPDEDLVTGA